MHEGHRDRIRKKFLTNGLDKFEEHEVLELLLFYAIPRKNTNELAHKLIKKFGSLVAVFDAPIGTLKDVEGVGESTAIFIKTIPEFCRIYMDNKYGNIKNNSNNSTIEEYGKKLILKFLGMNEEAVAIILLNAKGKVVFDGIINKGTVNSVDLYIRKIVELIIMYNACSIILAHNHPSGVASPSSDDVNSTIKLNRIFSGLKVNFLDHIIIAEKNYVSMRNSGMEDIFNSNY